MCHYSLPSTRSTHRASNNRINRSDSAAKHTEDAKPASPPPPARLPLKQLAYSNLHHCRNAEGSGSDGEPQHNGYFRVRCFWQLGGRVWVELCVLRPTQTIQKQNLRGNGWASSNAKELHAIIGSLTGYNRSGEVFADSKNHTEVSQIAMSIFAIGSFPGLYNKAK